MPILLRAIEAVSDYELATTTAMGDSRATIPLPALLQYVPKTGRSNCRHPIRPQDLL